jgi:hypothetical protein
MFSVSAVIGPAWSGTATSTAASVATPPTARTSRQLANAAASTGAAASSPTKLAREPSAISIATTSASSTKAAPRPARELRFVERFMVRPQHATSARVTRSNIRPMLCPVPGNGCSAKG